MIDEDDTEYIDLRYEAAEARRKASRHGMTEEEAEEDAVMTASEAAWVNNLMRSY